LLNEPLTDGSLPDLLRPVNQIGLMMIAADYQLAQIVDDQALSNDVLIFN
jgi:hypothetical protein